jgi:hypothetical protein
MYVGKLLPVVVLHDEIRFALFKGPGRREAARFPLVLPQILFDVKFTETTGHILDIALH